MLSLYIIIFIIISIIVLWGSLTKWNFINKKKISKIFYQSWCSPLPKIISEKNNKYIPENFEYKLFSLKDIRNYLSNNWGEKIVSLYDKYDKIPHKVDLWRYCILYDTGGIYMDADCILLNNIESLINNCSSFYVSNNRGVKDIFNGFLGTYPKNPIYKKIIDFMVQEGVNIKDYYYNCKQLYKIVSENYLLMINKNYYDDTIFYGINSIMMVDIMYILKIILYW